MGKIVSKIVLTGGPCAGKTTALASLEEILVEKGYAVFIVSESATELIKGGIKPFGNFGIPILDFQRIILDLQLSKEKIFEDSAHFVKDRECIIIYDRGVMDNKAYISKKEFQTLLVEKSLNEIELIDHYDLVLHLTTAANGKEEYYTLENNSARTESIEEARLLDDKTLNAWIGHSNLEIFSNEVSFQDKIDQVINTVLRNIGINVRNQRKYLINLKSSDLSFISDENATEIDIEQTYIKMNEHETRLRKRTLNNTSTYYLTVQKKETNGKSQVVTNKKITEKEYLKLLEYPHLGTIKKKRICFQNNSHYFRLDIYDDHAVLELDVVNEKNINIPKELIVIKEVTDNPKYDNANFDRNQMLVLNC